MGCHVECPLDFGFAEGKIRPSGQMLPFLFKLLQKVVRKAVGRAPSVDFSLITLTPI